MKTRKKANRLAKLNNKYTVLIFVIILMMISLYCYIVDNLLTEKYYNHSEHETKTKYTMNIFVNESMSNEKWTPNITNNSTEEFDIFLYNVSNINLHKLQKSRTLVVTGYINLGNFEKIDNGIRKKKQYFKWVKKFSKIQNHVICFTDDINFYEFFLELRAGLPTTVVGVDLADLPSYRKVNVIQDIFDQPGYAPYEPDTQNAEYVTVMNGKYDFIAKAMKMFPYATHVMWLDIGLFRRYPSDAPCFYLAPPPNFQKSKIVLNVINSFESNLTSESIVFELRVWVCGGIFFGTRRTMTKFIAQYRSAIDRLISMKMIGSDQQTLYSVYADRALADLKKVKVQAYVHSISLPYFDNDKWFYLGYLMRREEKCYNKLAKSKTLNK